MLVLTFFLATGWSSCLNSLFIAKNCHSCLTLPLFFVVSVKVMWIVAF